MTSQIKLDGSWRLFGQMHSKRTKETPSTIPAATWTPITTTPVWDFGGLGVIGWDKGFQAPADAHYRVDVHADWIGTSTSQRMVAVSVHSVSTDANARDDSNRGPSLGRVIPHTAFGASSDASTTVVALTGQLITPLVYSHDTVTGGLRRFEVTITRLDLAVFPA